MIILQIKVRKKKKPTFKALQNLHKNQDLGTSSDKSEYLATLHIPTW